MRRARRSTRKTRARRKTRRKARKARSFSEDSCAASTVTARAHSLDAALASC